MGLFILFVFLGLLWICAEVLGAYVNEMNDAIFIFAAIVVILISIAMLAVGLTLVSFN